MGMPSLAFSPSRISQGRRPHPSRPRSLEARGNLPEPTLETNQPDAKRICNRGVVKVERLQRRRIPARGGRQGGRTQGPRIKQQGTLVEFRTVHRQRNDAVERDLAIGWDHHPGVHEFEDLQPRPGGRRGLQRRVVHIGGRWRNIRRLVRLCKKRSGAIVSTGSGTPSSASSARSRRFSVSISASGSAATRSRIAASAFFTCEAMGSM